MSAVWQFKIIKGISVMGFGSEAKMFKLLFENGEVPCTFVPDEMMNHYYLQVFMRDKSKQIRIDIRTDIFTTEEERRGILAELANGIVVKEEAYPKLKSIMDAAFLDEVPDKKHLQDWIELVRMHCDQASKVYQVDGMIIQENAQIARGKGNWLQEEISREIKTALEEYGYRLDRVFEQIENFIDLISKKEQWKQFIPELYKEIHDTVDEFKCLSATFINERTERKKKLRI